MVLPGLRGLPSGLNLCLFSASVVVGKFSFGELGKVTFLKVEILLTWVYKGCKGWVVQCDRSAVTEPDQRGVECWHCLHVQLWKAPGGVTLS